MNEKSAQKVVVIVGPTASGKSALAIDLALLLNGVVINCDSMQIYKDIPIITAAPDAEDKAKVPHRLYEIYDCAKRGNVVEWLDLAVAEIKNAWRRNLLPIVVGGTGMYAEALIKGVTPIPEVEPKIRQSVAEDLQNKGLDFLYAELQKVDEKTAQKLHCNDKTRIVRAVEIYRSSGKKVSEWYQMPLVQKLPEADFIKVKIMPPLEVIDEQCKKRLEQMVYGKNVLQEISRLLERNLAQDLPAMKALGVPELSLAVKGELTPEDALEQAKLHTRQYAKRQRTWLKNRYEADVEIMESYKGQQEFLQKIKESF